MRALRWIILATAVAACGSDSSPPDAAAGAPTIAAIRSDVFDASCSLSGCHTGDTPAAKLDLHSDTVCHELVLHTSCLFPGKMLVVPGKPEMSFLLDKLRGTGLTGAPTTDCADTNQRMPFGAAQL